MPAGKRPQSDAMLYTLITFVALFIIATTVAVIYYVKFEEQIDMAETAERNLREMATSPEWQKRGAIVGAKGRASYLGKMVGYLDEMVYLIIGAPLEETSAEVKVDTVNRKIEDTLELLAQEQVDIEASQPF